ncbi:MAG: leucine-rich repeat domain-containing protein [Flavobacteriales bacterium]|nr:leucine-rich repeat domain-containing protein [Flavobacteriales bacterium]
MNLSAKILCILVFIGIGSGTSVYGQAEIDHCDDAETYYSLEDALKEPEKVVKLDIAMNKLTSIDPNIAKLVNLECLDLSFNKFSTLPAEIAELKKLRVLDLTGTRFLAKVPDIVSKIANLEELSIKDHPEWKGTQFDDAKKMLPNVKVISTN